MKTLEDLKNRYRNGAPTHPSKFGNAEGIQQQFDEMLVMFPDDERFIIFALEWTLTPEEILEDEERDFKRMPFRIAMCSMTRNGEWLND